MEVSRAKISHPRLRHNFQAPSILPLNPTNSFITFAKDVRPMGRCEIYRAFRTRSERSAWLNLSNSRYETALHKFRELNISKHLLSDDFERKHVCPPIFPKRQVLTSSIPATRIYNLTSTGEQDNHTYYSHFYRLIGLQPSLCHFAPSDAFVVLLMT
jgi:hypothetical protein